jgi:hypothetical protein
MATVNLTSNLENTAVKFHASSAQTQLVVLNYLARKIHQASKNAAPSAFFSQKVQSVLKQIQQLPREERQEALTEILNGAPTRLTEAYEALDTNMRMAFWYRLANSRRDDGLLPQPLLQEGNAEQNMLLLDLESRDSNELVSFLRVALEESEAA